MNQFNENEHPRSDDGKFTDKNSSYADGVNERIKWAKENGIDLPISADGSVDDLKLQELYERDKTPENSLKVLLGERFVDVKGQAAIEKLLKEKRGHVKGAFHREDIGDIDLLWGNDALGLQHIIKQRENQGINIEEFLSDISEVIEEGEFFQKNERGNFEFLHNGKMAIIAPEFHGNRLTFVLTAYKTRKKRRL